MKAGFMTPTIKEAKKLNDKIFDPETGAPLRDITRHYTRKANDLLDAAGNDVYEYDSDNGTNYYAGLLIIANPGKDI